MRTRWREAACRGPACRGPACRGRTVRGPASLIGALALVLVGAAVLPGSRALGQSLEPSTGFRGFRVETAAKVVLPGQKVRKDELALVLTAIDADGKTVADFTGTPTLSSGGEPICETVPAPVDGVIRITGWTLKTTSLEVRWKGFKQTETFRSVGWLCLLPPLIAIALALTFRQVLMSLFGGIWLGHAVLELTARDGTVTGLVKSGLGFFPALSETVVGAMADADHAKIIFFTLMMGGMVGIIASSGALRAIVELIAKRANSPRTAQLATWGMGLTIFFDDYANTMLVGNTMRPFTDRFRISREKLSYIVDSTAAPVAALFLISTWIGYEVGLIDDMLQSGIEGRQGYETFVSSVPYRFYSIFCLVMVMLVALTGRDFGPMLAAEKRARLEGKVLRDGAHPLLDEKGISEFEGKKEATWGLAAAPILTMIVTILLFLVVTGYGPAQANAKATLRGLAPLVKVDVSEASTFNDLWGLVAADSLEARLEPAEVKRWRRGLETADRQSGLSGILSEASSYDALVWGAGLGALVALLVTILGGVLTMEQASTAFMDGLKAMLLAAVVLCLAWSLGTVCSHLRTGDYIAQAMEGVPAGLLPTIVFLLSAIIAFSTGTSWGTMAIVFPVLGPLLVKVQESPDFESILLGSVGAVLAGACFGDHASPISDTTVLSSMASGADHIDHVRTQLPYAGWCATIAILTGFLPAGYGVSPWLTLPVGLVCVAGGLWLFGEETPDGPEPPAKGEEPPAKGEEPKAKGEEPDETASGSDGDRRGGAGGDA